MPFLVDTGAGVSLLSGHVWDKVGLSTKLSATALDNLVGVGRHPIQIRGSVTVPVMIAEATFTQEFRIADNITAEGILGMDFLEKYQCVVNIAKREIVLEHSNSLPLVTSATTSSHSINVTICNTVIIPPNSEMEIFGRLSAEGGP